MDDEDYDMVPHKEIMGLKNEVSKLKKSPFASNEESSDLLSGIKGLNGSINTLMELFQEANTSLKVEEREEDLLKSKIDPLLKHVESIVDQNKKMAQGIVAIADMIEEHIGNFSNEINYIKRELSSLKSDVSQGISSQSRQPYSQSQYSGNPTGQGQNQGTVSPANLSQGSQNPTRDSNPNFGEFPPLNQPGPAGGPIPQMPSQGRNSGGMSRPPSNRNSSFGQSGFGSTGTSSSGFSQSSGQEEQSNSSSSQRSFSPPKPPSKSGFMDLFKK